MREAQPPADAQVEPLKPDFQNFRGAMFDYDQASNAPNLKNVSAFCAELIGGIQTDDEGNASDWEDVLRSVENGIKFWSHYYCGQEWKGE